MRLTFGQQLCHRMPPLVLTCRVSNRRHARARAAPRLKIATRPENAVAPGPGPAPRGAAPHGTQQEVIEASVLTAAVRGRRARGLGLERSLPPVAPAILFRMDMLDQLRNRSEEHTSEL